eukprot:gene9832-2154_t
MVHPHIIYEVTFPENNKAEVIKTMEQAIIATRHFDLDLDNKEADVTANFLTASCKWLDIVTFKCTEEKETSCTFTVKSTSTSILCCNGMSCLDGLRLKLADKDDYSDWNQNQKHIEVLLRNRIKLVPPIYVPKLRQYVIKIGIRFQYKDINRGLDTFDQLPKNTDCHISCWWLMMIGRGGKKRYNQGYPKRKDYINDLKENKEKID